MNWGLGNASRESRGLLKVTLRSLATVATVATLATPTYAQTTSKEEGSR